MKLLADTHLLLWVSAEPGRLSRNARILLEDPANAVFFSTVSIWEAAIKHGRRPTDFPISPQALHEALLAQGYSELLMTSAHAMAVATLPMHHRDPFDRLLVAQSQAEGDTLLTADQTLAQYAGVLRV